MSSLASDPIPRGTLRDEATRRLRSEIVSGVLAPATLYPIAEVAARMGVSITPIREALLELTRDGLVEIARNRGFRIREVTEADLDEIVELRLMLEVPAVRKLAGGLTGDDITKLRAAADAVSAAAGAGDIPTYLLLDRAFHLELLAHSGNERLVAMVAKLRDETRLYGLGRLVGTEPLMATTHEHVELIEALAAGDGEAAAIILGSHLRHARGVWAGREGDSGGQP